MIRPPGARRRAAGRPTRARDRARAGTGEDLTDTTVDGHAPARAHARRCRAAARSRWRARSTRSTAQLDRVLLVADRSSAPRGVALGGGARGPASRARRSRRSARFTRRTEELAARPGPLRTASTSTGATSSAGWRAASTRRSTRSSARSRRSASSWPTRATSCARRSRACARTSRRSSTPTGCRRRSCASLRADIVAELDELTALVADVVELARGAKPGELRRRRAARRDRGRRVVERARAPRRRAA